MIIKIAYLKKNVDNDEVWDIERCRVIHTYDYEWSPIEDNEGTEIGLDIKINDNKKSQDKYIEAKFPCDIFVENDLGKTIQKLRS